MATNRQAVSKGSYSVRRGDPALVSEVVREYQKLGSLLAKMGIALPEPTAREEFRAAEGSKPGSAPKVNGSRLVGESRKIVGHRLAADLKDPRIRGRVELFRRFEPWGDVRVKILEDGFLFAGKKWGSLSAIATTVAGSPRNGYEFFGLGKRPPSGGGK